MESYEKEIIEFLKTNGPSHPSQLNSVIKKDTFFSKVILDELKNSGKILTTKGKLGGSPLYYLPMHEEKAKKMIFEGLDFVSKKFVKKIKEKRVIKESELSVQEKYILPKCLDFIIPIKRNNETYFKYYLDLSNEIISNTSNMPRIEPKTQESLFKQKISETSTNNMEDKIREKEINNFETITQNKLVELNFAIINKNKKKKGEIEYEIISQNPIKQKYYVKAKNKKRVSESDLAVAFTEAQKRKLPLIFVSENKLSKKVKEFANKNYGGLMTIIELK